MATKPLFSEPMADARPARLVLRDATRPDHDRVDAAFSAFRLDEPEGYARFLAAQYLAHREAECWLAQAEIPARLRLTDRSPLIAADLAALDRDTPGQGVPFPQPPSGSFAQIAGVLYCLTGSSFGNRVLLQRINRGAPSAFLSFPLPADTWPRLVAALDSVAAQGGMAACIAGARRTFALFAECARRARTETGR